MNIRIVQAGKAALGPLVSNKRDIKYIISHILDESKVRAGYKYLFN